MKLSHKINFDTSRGTITLAARCLYHGGLLTILQGACKDLIEVHPCPQCLNALEEQVEFLQHELKHCAAHHKLDLGDRLQS